MCYKVRKEINIFFVAFERESGCLISQISNENSEQILKFVNNFPPTRKQIRTKMSRPVESKLQPKFHFTPEANN